MPPECRCLRGSIASLAANGSARRFASASIIRCRSADLAEVHPNHRLPIMHTVSIVRTAASAAMPPRQAIAKKQKFKVDGNCVRLPIRRQSDSEDRSRPNRLAAKNSRHPIRQAPQLFKLLACNVKTFLLGDLKGAVLFCEREQPPLPRSLLARRDNFALHWKSFSSSSLLISKLSTSTSAFALKCSGSSSLLHSALRFSTLSGPIRPRS